MKILSVLLLAAFAFAQDPSRRTEITVNEPILVVGVPQVTLQPGKYVFRVLSHDHTRNIVQIFDAKNKLMTTVLAINNYRLKPVNNTALRFWETPSGNPPALRAWFAPGDEWGQEFVYPKGLATQIARATGGPVLTARAATETELTTAPVTEVIKSGEEKPLEEAFLAPNPPQTTPTEVAQSRPVAPAPAPEPTAERAPTLLAQVQAPPASAPTASTESLPATATPIWAVGLTGIGIAAIGLALRHALRHAE